LSVFIRPGCPELPAALEFLTVPRTRQVHPQGKILIETINGEPAAASPYREALTERGFLPDRGKLVLW
jgi:hypothetical protein